MPSPPWREACFSVGETAEIIGTSEVSLRTWLARNPLDEFGGTKQAGRIWLSARDGYYYRLVHVLSEFGVPVRTAMYSAAAIAEFGDPQYKYLIVETAGGRTTFRSTEDAAVTGPSLIIPLFDLHVDHLERCARVYAIEGA